jgi:hypothetical protein
MMEPNELQTNFEEMLINIFRQLDTNVADKETLKQILVIFKNKYMAEAFIRPIFGDNDELYSAYYDLLYGVAKLNRIHIEDKDW